MGHCQHLSPHPAREGSPGTQLQTLWILPVSTGMLHFHDLLHSHVCLSIPRAFVRTEAQDEEEGVGEEMGNSCGFGGTWKSECKHQPAPPSPYSASMTVTVAVASPHLSKREEGRQTPMFALHKDPKEYLVKMLFGSEYCAVYLQWAGLGPCTFFVPMGDPPDSFPLLLKGALGNHWLLTPHLG